MVTIRKLTPRIVKILPLTLLFFVEYSYALCQLCWIAVGAGTGISRYFALDNAVFGLWLGAFILLITMVTIDWSLKKEINLPGRNYLIPLIYYLSFILAIYLSSLFNIDLGSKNRLILGIIIGSLTLWSSILIYKSILKKRGRAYFPFQKVVIPILFLLLLSFLLQYLL